MYLTSGRRETLLLLTYEPVGGRVGDILREREREKSENASAAGRSQQFFLLTVLGTRSVAWQNADARNSWPNGTSGSGTERRKTMAKSFPTMSPDTRVGAVRFDCNWRLTRSTPPVNVMAGPSARGRCRQIIIIYESAISRRRRRRVVHTATRYARTGLTHARATHHEETMTADRLLLHRVRLHGGVNYA